MYRQMYTTQNNRQRESNIDREEEEEEVTTNKCIQHRKTDREILTQSEGGGEGKNIKMYTTRTIDRERYLDKEEQEVGTDRQNNTQMLCYNTQIE